MLRSACSFSLSIRLAVGPFSSAWLPLAAAETKRVTPLLLLREVFGAIRSALTRMSLAVSAMSRLVQTKQRGEYQPTALSPSVANFAV